MKTGSIIDLLRGLPEATALKPGDRLSVKIPEIYGAVAEVPVFIDRLNAKRGGP